MATTPIGLGSLASAAVADWQHMDLPEARGLVVFLGCPRGIGELAISGDDRFEAPRNWR